MTEAKHSRFTVDIKINAVETVLSSDRPMSYIAKELDIPTESLTRWVGEYRTKRRIASMADFAIQRMLEFTSENADDVENLLQLSIWSLQKYLGIKTKPKRESRGKRSFAEFKRVKKQKEKSTEDAMTLIKEIMPINEEQQNDQ